MTLEDMIFSRLKTDAELARMLASYDQRAAVFYQRAASDSDAKWDGGQFPRIDFIADMQEDPAANASGILAVNIWCDTGESVEPEQIEQRIRSLLHASFAQPDNSPVYCFLWVRSEAFDKEATSANPYIAGYTVIFTIQALPAQQTVQPDPISAINEWTKAQMPQSVVIGRDAVQGWLVPSGAAPAIYWQLTTLSPARITNCCVWMRGELTGHIFAPSAAERMNAGWGLTAQLSLENHVTMNDDSPMFVESLVTNSQANYLLEGQIKAVVRFGILRSFQESPKLLHTNIPREVYSGTLDAANVAAIAAGHRILYALAGTRAAGMLPEYADTGALDDADLE